MICCFINLPVWHTVQIEEIAWTGILMRRTRTQRTSLSWFVQWLFLEFKIIFLPTHVITNQFLFVNHNFTRSFLFSYSPIGRHVWPAAFIFTCGFIYSEEDFFPSYLFLFLWIIVMLYANEWSIFLAWIWARAFFNFGQLRNIYWHCLICILFLSSRCLLEIMILYIIKLTW